MSKKVGVEGFSALCNVENTIVYKAIYAKAINVDRAKNGRLEIDVDNERPRLNRWLSIPEDRRPTYKSVPLSDDEYLNGKVEEDNEPETKNALYLIEKRQVAAKLLKEESAARKAKVEADIAEGKAIDINIALRIIEEMAAKTSKAMLNIPDRLAPVIAAELDSHKVHKMMKQEIRHSLSSLSIGIREIIELKRVEEKTQ